MSEWLIFGIALIAFAAVAWTVWSISGRNADQGLPPRHPDIPMPPAPERAKKK